MKRDNHITIRLSDEELVHIENKVKEYGVTRSEYMRIRLINFENENIKSTTVYL
jgi:predicted DNA binding CopG/RHH family protein